MDRSTLRSDASPSGPRNWLWTFRPVSLGVARRDSERSMPVDSLLRVVGAGGHDPNFGLASNVLRIEWIGKEFGLLSSATKY
jgi:hypothetical protein